MMFAADAVAGPAEDKAAADALFREGRTLVKAGKYAEGCPKLEASQNLDPAVGTLLALGDCYELQGKTASAWATFNDAQTLAKKREDKRREPETVRRANLLEPKLSKLTIDVPADVRVAGLEVKRNGKILDAGLFGSALPVDPGEQVIDVTAPGKQPYHTNVQIEAKPGVTTLRIPVLEAAPVPKTDPTKPDPANTTPPAGGDPGKTNSTSGPSISNSLPVKPDQPTSTWGTQKKIGVVVGGVGLLALVAGSITGIMTISKMDDVYNRSLCTHSQPVRCNGPGISAVNDARFLATQSNVMVGVGAVAVVTGVVLFATGSKGKSSKTTSSIVVQPLVGTKEMGLSMQGVF